MRHSRGIQGRGHQVGGLPCILHGFMCVIGQSAHVYLVQVCGGLSYLGLSYLGVFSGWGQWDTEVGM